MALLVLVPLAAAAFGLYWLFKSPEDPVGSAAAVITDILPETLDDAVQVATVHSAPQIVPHAAGK